MYTSVIRAKATQNNSHQYKLSLFLENWFDIRDLKTSQHTTTNSPIYSSTIRRKYGLDWNSNFLVYVFQ